MWQTLLKNHRKFLGGENLSEVIEQPRKLPRPGE
jgi:hypothetical protein